LKYSPAGVWHGNNAHQFSCVTPAVQSLICTGSHHPKKTQPTAPWKNASETPPTSSAPNSGLKAQEYSGPILGIIFLRFAEVRFAQQRAKLEKAVAFGVGVDVNERPHVRRVRRSRKASQRW
jgi:hypothetical protein